MNINENQEFEAINQKVKERTETVEEDRQISAETYREVQVRKKLKAMIFIIIAAGLFAVAATGFWVLEGIEWINHTFRIVLTAASGAVAMFMIGGFWHGAKD